MKVCSSAGCPTLVPRGTSYCQTCVGKGTTPKKFSDRARGTAAERGYGSDWRRLRRVVLAEQPLCLLCEEEGRVGASTCVDHIRPRAAGGTDDRSNLRGLCEKHHHSKTAREASEIRKGTYGR